MVEHHRGHVRDRPLPARRLAGPVPREEQHAERVAPVERTVAAAAHVVGAAPVHELVAGHRPRPARRRSRARRAPTTAGRARPGRSRLVTPPVVDARASSASSVALDAPAPPARVLSSPPGAKRSSPRSRPHAAPRRPRAAPRGRRPRASEAGRAARAASSVAARPRRARRPSPSARPGRRRARPRSGRVVRREHAASRRARSARFTRSSTRGLRVVGHQDHRVVVEERVRRRRPRA